MKYTVLWKPDAERRLATIWLQTGDRRAVRSAADEIDHLLATDPVARGESRDEGRRVLIQLPLGVFFRVNQGDRKVSVLAVWEIKKRR
jgi:plasmid stabilization system protein ParE